MIVLKAGIATRNSRKGIDCTAHIPFIGSATRLQESRIYAASFANLAQTEDSRNLSQYLNTETAATERFESCKFEGSIVEWYWTSINASWTQGFVF